MTDPQTLVVIGLIAVVTMVQTIRVNIAGSRITDLEEQMIAARVLEHTLRRCIRRLQTAVLDDSLVIRSLLPDPPPNLPEVRGIITVQVQHTEQA